MLASSRARHRVSERNMQGWPCGMTMTVMLQDTTSDKRFQAQMWGCLLLL